VVCGHVPEPLRDGLTAVSAARVGHLAVAAEAPLAVRREELQQRWHVTASEAGVEILHQGQGIGVRHERVSSVRVVAHKYAARRAADRARALVLCSAPWNGPTMASTLPA